MEALFVIDMQKGSFKNVKRFNANKVIRNINTLAQKFRENGHVVIFIQHDGSMQGDFLPNTEDWEIIDKLVVAKSDVKFSKTANDAFYQTDLNRFLQDQNINNIYITGCATDYCVNATIHSALTKDYSITVVGDGHTTADRPMVKAKKLVRFHNWLWADLTPTKGKIVVKYAEEINPTAAST